MDAPKCRLCGKRHWGVVCFPVSVFESRGRKTPAKTEAVANNPDMVANVVANSRSSSTVERPLCKRVVSGSIPESGSKKVWTKPVLKRYANVSLTENVSLTGFDRKVYQREYMKKRRQK